MLHCKMLRVLVPHTRDGHSASALCSSGLRSLPADPPPPPAAAAPARVGGRRAGPRLHCTAAPPRCFLLPLGRARRRRAFLPPPLSPSPSSCHVEPVPFRGTAPWRTAAAAPPGVWAVRGPAPRRGGAGRPSSREHGGARRAQLTRVRVTWARTVPTRRHGRR